MFLILFTESLRVGTVEVASTPPILTSPDRYSTELSFIEHAAHDYLSVERRDSDLLGPGSISARSTLLSPGSGNARSSYMTSNTDTSRMSGLSDFPVPPNIMPSVSSTSLHAQPPRLVREPSLSTFGRQDSASDYGTIGEAL